MTRIVAHRGLHRPHFDAPENSLASMQAAWSAGIAWCECDIRFSRDEVAMVIHDAAIERQRRNAIIAQSSAAELGQLGVPSLADILAAMPANAALLIEPKTRINSSFLSWLRAYPTTGQIQLHTFHLDDLPALAAASFTVAAIVDDPAMLDAAIASPASAIHVEQKLFDPQLMSRVRRAGKSIGVWTVNEESTIRAILEQGPDTLITDNPLFACARRA